MAAVRELGNLMEERKPKPGEVHMDHGELGVYIDGHHTKYYLLMPLA